MSLADSDPAPDLEPEPDPAFGPDSLPWWRSLGLMVAFFSAGIAEKFGSMTGWNRGVLFLVVFGAGILSALIPSRRERRLLASPRAWAYWFRARYTLEELLVIVALLGGTQAILWSIVSDGWTAAILFLLALITCGGWTARELTLMADRSSMGRMHRLLRILTAYFFLPAMLVWMVTVIYFVWEVFRLYRPTGMVPWIYLAAAGAALECFSYWRLRRWG